MKVKANKNFESIIDATIGRVRKNGEVWEVSEQRAKVLLEHNLVSVVEEEEKKPRKPRTKK